MTLDQAQSEQKETKSEEVAPPTATADEPKAVEEAPAGKEAPDTRTTD